MARKLPKGKVKETFAVRIPAGKLRKMRLRARQQGIDVSEWMRKALTAWLEAGR